MKDSKDTIMNEAIEAIVQELLERQYASTQELSEKVGDADACRRALMKLNRARAITKRIGSDSTGKPAEEWVFQNPDRFRGKGSLAVLGEIFPAREETDRIIYGKYMKLETKIKLTTPCLAGTPDGDGNLVFRRLGGKIWLMPAYFEAMFRDGARRTEGLGVKARNAASKWTDFEQVLLDNKIEYQKLIAPGGKGIFSGEVLPIGTEIPVSLSFPSTQIDAEQIMGILHEAGKWVGFSIAKSRHGWGRFEVIG